MRKNKKINATFRHGGMKVNSSHSGVKVSNKRQRVYSKNKKNLYNRKNNIKNQNQSYYSQSRKKRFMTSTSNMIVNYTPDFYDKAHGDVSIHASKVVIGNSFMVARNFKRIGVSLMDRVNKIRARGNYSYGNIEKARKIESNIGKHRGFSIRTSVRQTVSNQTRKLTHKATNQNDFSSETLGKGMRMTWATVKYRKKFVTAVKSVAFFIRSTISSIIALVTSIPAMLVSIIASIPALIVVLIISIIITFFSSYQYYGRIDGLMEHINQLNAKYQVNIDVIDLLSITYALDWTQGSYEMYDTLCSYIYTTKGEQVDFEDALTKVFKNK